ncbi:MAG: histidine phosphatase family protein [Planctomycetota bacterium]
MIELYMMRAGRTVWEESDRIEPPEGTPLSEAGAEEIQAASRQLAGRGIGTVYTSDGQSEQASARLAAGMLRAKVKVRRKLHEQDFGLWQGLTVAEIKRRHPKQYRQWKDSPQTFRAPDGETVPEARERLTQAVRQIARRHKNGPMLLVLRPIALALVRSVLQDQPAENFWQYVSADYTWGSYQLAPREL